MTSASEEKWRPFNYFFSRVGLKTYQHPCSNDRVRKFTRNNGFYIKAIFGRLPCNSVFILSVYVFMSLFSCGSRVSERQVNVTQSHYRPGQALRVPEFEAPRFQDNRHMKVVSLSTLGTGRLYPTRNILVLISVRH